MFLLFTIFIVTILSILFYKGYTNTKQVLVNNVFISDANLDTRVNEEPFRVLHISDMHLENISVSPAHLYSILNGQSIDLQLR